MRKIITIVAATAMLGSAGIFAAPALIGSAAAKPETKSAISDTARDDGAGARNNSEKLEKAISKYQKIREDVTAVQHKAMEAKEVKKALEDFQGVVMKRMKQIDPKIETKIDKLEKLAAEIQELHVKSLGQQAPAPSENKS